MEFQVLQNISSVILQMLVKTTLRKRHSSGEGPRSRRYGRTAALRLLVQACDEDDDDDDYFYPFPSNGAPVE
jgi:hypothetical protein